MPYEGDSPTEAWEYWFDEEPSSAVVECLSAHVKAHSVPVVLDAIEVTGRRALDITDETARLRYMGGVLRRKQLEQVFPGRADEERNIDVVRKCWDQHAFGFPLSRKYAREWLGLVSPEDLCWLINISSTWTTLKNLVEAVRAGVRPNEMKVLYKHAETWTEFRSLVDEVVAKRS